ncbi:hypothetical protein HY041_04395 [Candidatus Roizmanbacteria bacterium]|nr:hypothetical protein [Candidatus Roizmanbacteria bacterium]
MFTKQDFEQLKEIFATKEDLNRLENKLNNNMLNFKDEILHEIVAFREEMAVVTGYSDRIEDHDQRIEKLEKIVLH